MMRRRRNQADSGNGMANTCNYVVHLMTRKLAALAWFAPLRHLDLKLVGIDEIIRSHAEARGSHLFHCAPARVAVVIGLKSRLVLAAFTGVRLAADAIHRDGECFMRFLADRTERHGAGRETLYDLLGRLDFFNGDRP